ncbi:MAG: hypothetical protein PHH14_05725, partial [Candidatus Margulisbacteria bacterium]|nr:hypothetical protein [Candidatus Margulisiibacteriota bacterium]
MPPIAEKTRAAGYTLPKRIAGALLPGPISRKLGFQSLPLPTSMVLGNNGRPSITQVNPDTLAAELIPAKIESEIIEAKVRFQAEFPEGKWGKTKKYLDFATYIGLTALTAYSALQIGAAICLTFSSATAPTAILWSFGLVTPLAFGFLTALATFLVRQAKKKFFGLGDDPVKREVFARLIMRDKSRTVLDRLPKERRHALRNIIEAIEFEKDYNHERPNPTLLQFHLTKLDPAMNIHKKLTARQAEDARRAAEKKAAEEARQRAKDGEEAGGKTEETGGTDKTGNEQKGHRQFFTGRYALMEEIGAGAMGRWLRAED